MDNVNDLSVGTLAYVGDAVYELSVRTFLAKTLKNAGELNKAALSFVSAPAQANAFKIIEPVLDQTETAVFKRGRNFHTHNTPKNATAGEYHCATGFECLFGWLWLSEKKERTNELFEMIAENICK